MIKKNWKDHAPTVVHETGIDWRLFNCKHEKYKDQLMSEGQYDEENACMEVLRFVSLAWLQPGLAYHAHAHDDHEEVYYIMEGTGKIIVDEEEQSIKEGDCIYIPINSVHQIINDSDEMIKFLAFAGNIE